MSESGLKTIFSKNLNEILRKAGKSQTDLVNDLDLKSSTVSDWCTGSKFPRVDKIEMLAAYFGIKKSDLITENVKADANTIFNANEKLLLTIYRKLSPGGKTEVINFANYTLSKEQASIKEKEEIYLAAAHNDAPLTDEEKDLMRQDLDEL